MDETFYCLARVARVKGIKELQGIVAPSSIDLFSGWPETLPVSWRSALHPEGVVHTVAERLAVMLAELGWDAASGKATLDVPFRVVRRPGLFRAAEVEEDHARQMVVLSPVVGDPVATYGLPADASAIDVLADHGWVARPLEGWAPGSLGLDPVDWESILRHATAGRAALQRRATANDQAWHALIREAVLAGFGVATISSITGLTRQRVYQIRDGQR